MSGRSSYFGSNFHGKIHLPGRMGQAVRYGFLDGRRWCDMKCDEIGSKLVSKRRHDPKSDGTGRYGGGVIKHGATNQRLRMHYL